MKTIFTLLILFYQKIISPLLPGTCRFSPTCSEFALQSLEKYGVFKGSYKSICRILKCHPFHPGGYNPVD
ncbi:membrane protein insertion efficiency factor YidD [Natranaerobius trueperi]|uniref:Putative membrane protein insertion efficiency factor n=1 Tax=Natranaerobius trueperi TaxID=759412 RepID=A0A226BYV9_9FIRM|nr:membrane protein insertion efficiency factor YidD [Natranaerobius trueperi]